MRGFRASDDFMRQVEEWAAARPEPRPTTAEAVRQLIAIGLRASTSAPPLDQQLARVEKKLARKIPAKPSPEKGVALMRRGLAELQHQALVGKKAPGRKTAADPDGERRPDQATGKKGNDVTDGKLTRRAMAGAREAASKAARPKRNKT